MNSPKDETCASCDDRFCAELNPNGPACAFWTNGLQAWRKARQEARDRDGASAIAAAWGPTQNSGGKYCCEIMEQQLTYHCDMHGDGDACPDVVISICKSQFHEGEYQLIARNAEYICNFCPWCGADLKNWRQE